ncbi:protein of unknown function [Legionella micdadei]|uniref:Transposase n=1 Tax=Legionella micdadei TaxID=451 RepID=A0A098GIY3_LEGMI|nr:protein of unknown function [Legionella micdadei]
MEDYLEQRIEKTNDQFYFIMIKFERFGVSKRCPNAQHSGGRLCKNKDFL